MAAYDELVDLDGKLAVYQHSMVDHARPVTVHSYLTSTIPAGQYTNLIGWHVYRSSGSMYGRAVDIHEYGAHEWTIDFTGWEYVHREQPIEKPRDGREYTWKWAWGKWYKEPFARCPECREYHNPTWQYSDETGKCQRPKVGKRQPVTA